MSGAIRRIYVEDAVADHPRARSIIERFPHAVTIPCERYGEVFNRRAQNFRLQKRQPALVLAEKFDRLVLEAPPGYGVGGTRNFYFSHMLNCLYDCRYCFLQGMYRSANYVLFINYEDFLLAIDRRLAEAATEDSWFFSGYDCDSLAFDGVSGFVEAFLPFFENQGRAWLELRTKSVRIEPLLERASIANCVVAFSFTPEQAHRRLEGGVPSVERRLVAMERLAERGWPLGLRFDPLLYSEDYADHYRGLFRDAFARVPVEALHSVSLGPFRLPRRFHDTMYRLYPEEPLLAGPLADEGRMVGYPADCERELVEFCTAELKKYVPAERFFPCSAPG